MELRVKGAIGGSKEGGGQSGHGSHHGFRKGPSPPPQTAEGMLMVGGSWRSAGLFARFACDYIKNII